ncbi:uncharacterized protein LOC144326438 [Podarcis muralis]
MADGDLKRVPDVDIDEADGVFKYVLNRVTTPGAGPGKDVVRGYAWAEYHGLNSCSEKEEEEEEISPDEGRRGGGGKVSCRREEITEKQLLVMMPTEQGHHPELPTTVSLSR